MADEVDLEGIVESVAGGAPWAVADLRVTGEGQPPVELRHRVGFVLATPDGNRVSVDSAACALDGGVARSERGPWASAQATALGRMAAGFSAGPHFPVRIDGVGVGAGDRVRVRAEVVQRAAGDDPSYRGGHGPVSRVSAARALRVFGPRAAEIAPRPASRPAALVDDVMRALVAVGALALVAYALFLLRMPGSIGEAALRGGWATLAALTLFHVSARVVGYPGWSRAGLTFRHVPTFVPLGAMGAAPITVRRGASLGTLFLIFAAVSVPLVSLLGSQLGAPWRPPIADAPDAAVALWVGAVAAWGCVLALVLERRAGEGPARRLLGAMQRAAARRGAEGGFVRVEARCPIALRAAAALASRRVGGGRRSSMVTEVTPEDEWPLEVAMNAGGVPLVVRTGGALLASTASRSDAERVSSARIRVEVPAGAPVSIVGVFRPGEARVGSQGPESLVLLATPGGTPRGVFLRVALTGALSIALPVGGLVLTAAWAAITSST